MSPPLILLGTLQPSYWIGKLNLPQLPEIYSQLKKKSKVPKGKSQMTTAPLTLDWITSPVVPHWQLSSGRAHCGADQWLSRRSTSRYLINSWLLMGGAQGCTVQLLSKTCCLVTGCGVIRHSNGYLLRAIYAHVALLHKDTLGPVCWNLFGILSNLGFWFHMLV